MVPMFYLMIGCLFQGIEKAWYRAIKVWLAIFVVVEGYYYFNYRFIISQGYRIPEYISQQNYTSFATFDAFDAPFYTNTHLKGASQGYYLNPMRNPFFAMMEMHNLPP